MALGNPERRDPVNSLTTLETGVCLGGPLCSIDYQHMRKDYKTCATGVMVSVTFQFREAFGAQNFQSHHDVGKLENVGSSL